VDLNKLYSLRRDFTIIGLTGRTGSGCSRIAELLSGTFQDLESKGLREESAFKDEIFKRKYSICREFLAHGDNWVPFEIIRYVDVLLFYILHKHGSNDSDLSKLLLGFYKENLNEDNRQLVADIRKKVFAIDSKYDSLIKKIKSIAPFNEIKSDEDLKELGELFFNDNFKNLKNELFACLEDNNGYFRTRCMLHWVSCNLRSCGDAIGNGPEDISNIFSIANLINRLVKAKKVMNDTQPTKIVIDSLRNSLEIMFFKERYSAFYMVASKDVINNTKKRIDIRLSGKITDKILRENTISNILELDETEYRIKDFAKGKFSSPDVENCIQKSDFHIFNLKIDGLSDFVDEKFEGNADGFFTREEQLMKLVGLILQPGLITPSSAERAMQIANTAKLNSGCISRKVGAVVTDTSYYVKSVGWNDIAKGHTPCNLRSITDYFGTAGNLEANPHYSPFEKGNATETSSYKYKGNTPGNFKEAVVEYFKDAYDTNAKYLNGKNCSFCFKTVHNHFEGEANQVHTRSLHAEENAMLQITKLGGVGAEGGFLFTTASPCELCAKKAYQLGITKIFFIDPYPGISVDQILRGGQNKSQPKLVPFYGAIGKTYHELYDSFMSYKDEVAMTLEIKPKQKTVKELNNALSKIDDIEIKNFLKETNLNDIEVVDLVKKAIKLYKDKEHS
jgi:deoxycytidylate deaminase